MVQYGKKFKIDKNTYLLYEFLSFFNYYHFEDNKIKEKIDNLKQYIDKKIYPKDFGSKDIVDEYLLDVFILDD